MLSELICICLFEVCSHYSQVHYGYIKVTIFHNWRVSVVTTLVLRRGHSLLCRSCCVQQDVTATTLYPKNPRDPRAVAVSA